MRIRPNGRSRGLGPARPRYWQLPRLGAVSGRSRSDGNQADLRRSPSSSSIEFRRKEVVRCSGYWVRDLDSSSPRAGALRRRPVSETAAAWAPCPQQAGVAKGPIADRPRRSPARSYAGDLPRTMVRLSRQVAGKPLPVDNPGNSDGLTKRAVSE